MLTMLESGLTMDNSNWLIIRIQSFWFGLNLPLTALKVLLSKPRLLLLSILPVVVTLALYTTVIGWVQGQSQELLGQYLSRSGIDIHGWVASILFFFSKIILILIGIFTFSFVSNVIACPVNDFLAEQTEPFTTPPLARVKSPSWIGRLNLIRIDLVKTLVTLVGNLTVILTSWIPVVNFLAILFAFLLVSFQYISYPQTRRKQGIWDGAVFLWKHSFSCLGFGAAFTFLFSIPFLSCLCLPLAVIGGTLLVGRAQNQSIQGNKVFKLR